MLLFSHFFFLVIFLFLTYFSNILLKISLFYWAFIVRFEAFKYAWLFCQSISCHGDCSIRVSQSLSTFPRSIGRSNDVLLEYLDLCHAQLSKLQSFNNYFPKLHPFYSSFLTLYFSKNSTGKTGTSL